MTTSAVRRLAVLIDAENTSHRVTETLFAQVTALGDPVIRRAYGDFTLPGLAGWLPLLARWSIKPELVCTSNAGKNSADLALAVDAMDLLYGGWVDGFCLVSSDSDFTRVVQRIRENNYPVWGFGRSEAPESLRSACTRFLRLEARPDTAQTPTMATAVTPLKASTADPRPTAPGVLATVTPTPSKPVGTATERSAQQSLPRQTSHTVGIDKPIVAERSGASAAGPFVLALLPNLADDNGWINVGELGNKLKGAYPGFDKRHYGYARLSDLLRSVPQLELNKAGTQVRRRTPRS